MKVILINGSPNAKGCTYTALSEVADTLGRNGIDTEIVQLGKKPVHGCTACGSCNTTGKCIFDDIANTLADKIASADAVVIGTPVYYANPAGPLLAVLDRVFFSAGKRFAGKLGAAVVSARRGGCSTAFDAVNKFFLMSNIHVVSSQYWNQVHGFTPDDVRQDLEGLQTMRTLGNNMAWLLKCIDLGRQNGLESPLREEAVMTNFIKLRSDK